MNKKLKNLLISAAVLPGMALSVSSLAATVQVKGPMHAKRAICVMRVMPMRGMHHRMRMHRRHFNRHLTADQVKTIMQARLYMRGNKYVKVGSVQPITFHGKNHFYKVDIITKKSGDLVNKLVVNGRNARTRRI
ncbi:MAG: hypothetical protein KAS93_00415 [Gammaproteobacteria bacterium]|nr:hypothetical protein [Gammaproteobacteria bacterium]